MSRNQKAPLFAFVLVAMVCGLILVDSMRGEAFERRMSVLAPTQLEQLVTPAGREPHLTSDEQLAPVEPPVDGLGDPAHPFGSFGLMHDPASTSGNPVGSFEATAGGAVGASSTSQSGEDSGTEQAANAHGAQDGLRHGLRGHKNPHAANHGPDGGRPETHPEDQEPSAEAAPGVDGHDDSDGPGDRAGDGDPEGPADPEGEARPSEGPAGLDDGHQKRTTTKANKHRHGRGHHKADRKD